MESDVLLRASPRTMGPGIHERDEPLRNHSTCFRCGAFSAKNASAGPRSYYREQAQKIGGVVSATNAGTGTATQLNRRLITRFQAYRCPASSRTCLPEDQRAQRANPSLPAHSEKAHESGSN